MAVATLQLSHVPFRSSNLTLPPSPFSPKLPNTPPATPPHDADMGACCSESKSPPVIPPPRQPLGWIWTCHLCGQTYNLGVTTRCLTDGHRFCTGSAEPQRGRRKGRNFRPVACGSSFDYIGWKAWNDWKRKCTEIADLEQQAISDCVSPLFGRQTQRTSIFGPIVDEEEEYLHTVEKKQDCWNACNYPSECIVLRRAAALRSRSRSVSSSPTISPETTFDEILEKENMAPSADISDYDKLLEVASDDPDEVKITDEDESIIDLQLKRLSSALSRAEKGKSSNDDGRLPTIVEDESTPLDSLPFTFSADIFKSFEVFNDVLSLCVDTVSRARTPTAVKTKKTGGEESKGGKHNRKHVRTRSQEKTKAARDGLGVAGRRGIRVGKLA